MKLDTLTQRLNELTKHQYTQQDVLRWIDLCSGTLPNAKDPAFLKVRAHIFQRNTQGIWACVDKHCSAKHNTALEKGWPFGNVYVNQRQSCECGSPVYELAFCNECNEPHLLARDKKENLYSGIIKVGMSFRCRMKLLMILTPPVKKFKKNRYSSHPILLPRNVIPKWAISCSASIVKLEVLA